MAEPDKTDLRQDRDGVKMQLLGRLPDRTHLVSVTGSDVKVFGPVADGINVVEIRVKTNAVWFSKGDSGVTVAAPVADGDPGGYLIEFSDSSLDEPLDGGQRYLAFLNEDSGADSEVLITERA